MPWSLLIGAVECVTMRQILDSGSVLYFVQIWMPFCMRKSAFAAFCMWSPFLRFCRMKHHILSDKTWCFIWRSLDKLAFVWKFIFFTIFFVLVLRNWPIFNIWKFEIRNVCQKIRSIGTPNWRKTKWRHFVIRRPRAPYNCPH